MIDATLAEWPAAYRLNALRALARELPRPGRLVELARALSCEGTARALRRGHAAHAALAEGGDPGEWDHAETALVAEQVLLARVEVDVAWSGLDGLDHGLVGDAVVSADELAEATPLAFWLVPESTWLALEAGDPASFRPDAASWWGEVRAEIRAQREAGLAGGVRRHDAPADVPA